MPVIISQIVGLFGLICLVLSYQQNSQKRVVAFLMVSGSFMTLHFALLGAVTGVVMNIIGVFRAILYYNREKRLVSSVWCPVLMSLFCIVMGIIFWDNIWSLFPIIAMITSSVGLWMKRPAYLRLITITGSPFWIVYNFVNGAYSGLATEICVIVSFAVAIIRYDILKQKQSLKKEPC